MGVRLRTPRSIEMTAGQKASNCPTKGLFVGSILDPLAAVIGTKCPETDSPVGLAWSGFDRATANRNHSTAPGG
jgi:hypothetical protein